ncbi:hypothetical protein [Pedobacter jeongneungensis]|uniref:hypothetical protein n=1 Tax=Pedobacter jeongneungensis TaxID=947309 RepID=UPI000468D72D|nr:hypothetical protein [Pedobacter jeongneungensis]
MKLKQEGKTGTNGLDYFDICTDDFKEQFGYIAKKNRLWKLYIRLNGEKFYYSGSFIGCIKKAGELAGAEFN